jgi:hypothetical protein
MVSVQKFYKNKYMHYSGSGAIFAKGNINAVIGGRRGFSGVFRKRSSC